MSMLLGVLYEKLLIGNSGYSDINKQQIAMNSTFFMNDQFVFRSQVRLLSVQITSVECQGHAQTDDCTSLK